MQFLQINKPSGEAMVLIGARSHKAKVFSIFSLLSWAEEVTVRYV